MNLVNKYLICSSIDNTIYEHGVQCIAFSFRCESLFWPYVRALMGNFGPEIFSLRTYVRYVPAAITKDKLKCFNSIVHRDVATPNLAMLYG